MTEKVDASLDDIYHASNRTDAITRELRTAGDNADNAMSILSNSFVGSAGDSFTEFHLKLRYNSNQVYSSLEDIAEALDKAAENYDRTDMENADHITSQGVLVDALRGMGEDFSGDDRRQESTLPDMSEKELEEAFNDASPGVQETMISQHPELFAWHDGIPKADRHEANMILLEEHLDSDGPHDGEAQDLYDRVKEDDLMLLGFEPAQYSYTGSDDIQLRISDWSFITATGDPDHADTQIVNMGGTNSDKDWDYSSTQIDRAETLRDETLVDGQSEDEVVGIAYVGHDFPVNSGALSQSYARDSAQEFYDFTAGLKETHQGDSEPRQIWDAHSYSSMTAINADQISSDPPADAIILSGGAGTGDAVESASEMNVGEENVYVAMSDEDWISKDADELWHGGNLSREEFGGVRIDAGDGNHSSYWDEDSIATENKGRIARGEDPTTIPYYSPDVPEPPPTTYDDPGSLMDENPWAGHGR